jgi:SAM-dependent methyltransferase
MTPKVSVPLSDTKELNALRTWRSVYGEAAKASDWLAAHRWSEIHRQHEVANEIRAKMRLRPGDLTLEVGCGSGVMLSLVLSDGQRGIGLDQCEALIRRAPDFGVDGTRIRLGVADASRVPISSESVDRVLSFSVFQCFPSEEYTRRVLVEMMRICRPGGVIVIGDVYGVMEKQAQLLERLGLSRTLADALLVEFAPFWRLRQRLRSSGDGLRRRAFSRAFFRDALRGYPCDVEFLRQETPGRPYMQLRFDIRITKRAGSV